MHILIGYGYFIGTTGTYFEETLRQPHQVTFVGTPWSERPGFAPNMDIAEVAAHLTPKPDLFIYVDSGRAFYFPRGLERIECPTVCYLIDAYPPETGLPNTMRLRMAPFFDYLFVANKGCIDLYSHARDDLPVRWLPLAGDPAVQRDMVLERIYDVGFVGAIGGAYTERTAALARLSKRWKMNDYTRPYYGEEMARIYSQSKIVLNITLGRILNMRIFEAPPCGALLLTKRADNGQNDLFREGEHFDTFETLDELEHKVEYYLAHPEERERIARAGQAWALSHHTYAQRAQQILDTLAAHPEEQGSAPVRHWSPATVRTRYATLYSMLRLLDATMDEWTALRQMRTGRISATLDLAKALLRRVKYG
ncbi:MAG: glycosyltransferase [Anaerolineae bacterium]